MKLIRSKIYSPIDRLLILWAVCLIDHYNSNDEHFRLSEYELEKEFGNDMMERFFIVAEYADSYGLIDAFTMTLTEQGKQVATEWQRISDRIFSF